MFSISECVERETSTRQVVPKTPPITLASFPPDWRQFVGPGSESDVRRH